jgi:aryl-alcohol dehydrogenase-like predicted oxidoreductase
MAADERSGDMIYRKLGTTGERVSAIGLGGYHIGVPKTKEESAKLIRTAIDRGITFLDNCWDYGLGEAEIRMGNALRDGYRQKIFLMTKIDAHFADVATQQIEQCLTRLQTETIDLLQIHEVIRTGDPEKVFAPGGTMEALLKARRDGNIRYIGFTGHKAPRFLLDMLAVDFPWDSVQMPLNCLDPAHDSFEAQVLPVLVKRGIAVLGMKPLAEGEAVRSGAATADECLRYALSLPTSVVITGCESLELVEQALRIGRDFLPMTEADMVLLRARVATRNPGGSLEGYKNGRFDSTIRNPHWLTTAVP